MPSRYPPLCRAFVFENLRPVMDYRCEHCGFSGQPSGDTGSGFSCPVCHDGQADPWAIIRDIRSVLRLQGPTAAATRLEHIPAPDRFSSEWPLLEISILAIWSDLTVEELAGIAGDRVALEALLRRKYGYGTELANQLCTGVEELHERFNGQWEVVRECVPQHWQEIHERDVATMTGTMSELSGLVARRYSIKPDEARTEVADFLEKIDYKMLVRLFGSKSPGTRPEAAHDASEPTRRTHYATQ